MPLYMYKKAKTRTLLNNQVFLNFTIYEINTWLWNLLYLKEGMLVCVCRLSLKNAHRVFPHTSLLTTFGDAQYRVQSMRPALFASTLVASADYLHTNVTISSALFKIKLIQVSMHN